MNFPVTAFRFIFHFARKQWIAFSLIIFAFMVWATNDIIFPYLIKLIVNSISQYHGDFAGIFAAVGIPVSLIIIFWCVTEMFMRFQGIMQIYTFPKFRANIREAIFNYVKFHSQEYFSNNFAGNIAKKISDIPTSCQAIIEIVFIQWITIAVAIFFTLIMMWFVKPIFAMIFIIWLALHLTFMALFFRKSNILAEAHSESISVLSGKTVDVFSNIFSVKLFSRATYEADYLNHYQQDEIVHSQKALWSIEKMRFGLGINGLFLIFAMLFALLYGWTHQWISIGDFTQVFMQSFLLLGWLWYLSFQMTVFAREHGTISNALRLVAIGHDVIDHYNATPLVVDNPCITFSHVNFAYKENQPVFQDLNIKIQAGEKVGLVGFSGSGKSTFVNLCLRFYDIQSGEILIGDKNIISVTQDSLRENISMIPQDPSLFHRSLMENIRYGRLDATDDEVIEAAKAAHCHEFIMHLDDEYHTLVGERGIKLSGGQRQRIAIARAILKNAPILILDEATSSLDSVTEKLIHSSLHDLMQDKTTVVVAHRLSTLADMNRIVVFDAGKIVEEGTIEALLKKQGHFAKLWSMQMDGYLPK